MFANVTQYTSLVYLKYLNNMKKNYLYFLAFITSLLAWSFTNPANDTYEVDISKSEISWLGEKLSGEHKGKIQIKNGTLLINDGKLSGGEFVVDMTSITCTDIADDKTNGKLVGHLKSDDFFGVEKHPTATLKIINIKEKGDNTYGVRANLTIKAKTLPIEFVTTLDMKDTSVEATAKIVVDRAKYDVRYGSGSFFDNLGDKVIYDNFELDVKLMATYK